MPIILGGTDKEDLGSKPAQANSSSRPYVEKPFTKIGLVEWLEVNALCSSLSTTKKKKESLEQRENFPHIQPSARFISTRMTSH
jgi:hypothetical protein